MSDEKQVAGDDSYAQSPENAGPWTHAKTWRHLRKTEDLVWDMKKVVAEQENQAMDPWSNRLLEERENEAIQIAANELAQAKAHYDRLVAHREDRLNRMVAAVKNKLMEMG